MKKRLSDFQSWNKELEATFHDYMSTEPYNNVKNIIEESVEKDKQFIVFHEANPAQNSGTYPINCRDHLLFRS